MHKPSLEFQVQIYGDLTPVNDVLSKARCRIFYKYENRNGTFISDSFANELLESLPYTPVKGIFEEDDFTDHGSDRNEGRVYGIVPESNNVSWETHIDEDGIERLYACTDVYLFTALYAEASKIVGKSQSMELFAPSLVYHEAIIKGRRYVVFDHGRFLGLQVLGDKVEPCFEGAAFYSLQSTIEQTIQKIKQMSDTYSIGGNSEMKFEFKLSDDQKFTALWHLLNNEYNEAEENFKVQYMIIDVFDDYALVMNLDDRTYSRAYYNKDDEKDMVEITNLLPVFIMDITEEEKTTVETLRRLNGDTYELVDANLENAASLAEENVKLDAQVVEMSNTISTLNTEVEKYQAAATEFENEKAETAATIQNLNNELDSLKQYKYDIELQQKVAVLNEYADKLDNEVIETYRANLDSYSAVSLDKELLYEMKKAGSLRQDSGEFQIPKEEVLTGIDAILSRYKK